MSDPVGGACQCGHEYDNHVARRIEGCCECPCTAYAAPVGSGEPCEHTLYVNTHRCTKCGIEVPVPVRQVSVTDYANVIEHHLDQYANHLIVASRRSMAKVIARSLMPLVADDIRAARVVFEFDHTYPEQGLPATTPDHLISQLHALATEWFDQSFRQVEAGGESAPLLGCAHALRTLLNRAVLATTSELQEKENRNDE